MGFLKIFKSKSRGPSPLPRGSFTVDRTGEIISSTVSSHFSKEHLKQLSAVVLDTFEEANKADLPLKELAVQYDGLNLKARELKGGAIVFLSPRGKPSGSI